MRLLIVILSLLCFSNMVGAKAYKWLDADGHVHFGDKPPQAAHKEEIKLRQGNFVATKTASDLEEKKTKIQHNSGVVMYTTTKCPQCEQAKKYFEENDISFTEKNVKKGVVNKAEFLALKGKRVPLILIGKQRLDGFSVGSFKAAYKLYKK